MAKFVKINQLIQLNCGFQLQLAAKSVGFSDSVGETRSPRQTVNTQAFSQSVGGLPSFSRPLKTDVETSHLYIPPTEEFNMSAASGIQVLHMQEQIDAQNKVSFFKWGIFFFQSNHMDIDFGFNFKFSF